MLSMKMSIFSIRMGIEKALKEIIIIRNDIISILLQYRLNHSKITNIDTKNNG